MSQKTEIVKVTEAERQIMTRWVENSFLDVVCAKTGSEKTRKALGDEIRSNASAFAGPNPTPIETVLAETAAPALFFTAGLRKASRPTGGRRDEFRAGSARSSQGRVRPEKARILAPHLGDHPPLGPPRPSSEPGTKPDHRRRFDRLNFSLYARLDMMM